MCFSLLKAYNDPFFRQKTHKELSFSLFKMYKDTCLSLLKAYNDPFLVY